MIKRNALRLAAAAAMLAVVNLSAVVSPLSNSGSTGGDTAANTVARADLSSLTAGRTCTGADSPRLVNGVIVMDTTTLAVYEVTFAAALDLTKNGRTQVLAYCN